MHRGCCLRCFKLDKQLEMLKMDISGFEAWLPQGQEAQQSQIHSPWRTGLFPLSYTSVLQCHRGISFQTPLGYLLSCHLSGLWIHSPPPSCWPGRITSVPKQGIWEFWKPLRSFSVQGTTRPAAHRARRELCSHPTPRGRGVSAPWNWRKAPGGAQGMWSCDTGN